jgi:hypothetical protein
MIDRCENFVPKYGVMVEGWVPVETSAGRG